jgi:hypothetical protein
MAKTTSEITEYVRCEDQFSEAVSDTVSRDVIGEICNKLRKVARDSSHLVKLKQVAGDVLRRCNHVKDEVACIYYRKLLNAPVWRVDSLLQEYMTYLQFLSCMRNYGDEKMCRPPHTRRTKSQDENSVRTVEESLQKLPVEYVVEEGEIVVKVGKGEKLPETQFKATISELKKMGFEFDATTKLWRKAV